MLKSAYCLHGAYLLVISHELVVSLHWLEVECRVYKLFVWQ